ncbi:GNAT family N-acetyltransferase [Bosea eneae]|uniref:GNAT family N-acetyltransferase n=1 Tax=Bosea eneae TaxID=151454 RepID=A0ABW0J1L5_9HYPH
MIHDSRLVTARLIVRPFVAADAPLLVALFADPQVHRFVDDGQPLAPDVAALWIERSAANLERFGYGTGAVVERAGGELIGWAGFARPGDGTEELIYGLRRASWGRGLGKELLAGLVADGDDDHGHQGGATGAGTLFQHRWSAPSRHPGPGCLGGGAATVEFRPPLRATVADLEPVELIAPKAPMRLASDDTAAMELDLGRFATLQLDLVEAF